MGRPAREPAEVEFIDVTPLLPTMQKVNEAYEEATIPAATYETAEDIPTIGVPNVLIVGNDMADNVACALTTLMVEKKGRAGEGAPGSQRDRPGHHVRDRPDPGAPGLRARAREPRLRRRRHA